MKIGCVILAGGKSSRMGEDKALLEYEGKKFIEIIADELSFFEEKMIARGNNSELRNLENSSWKIIPDVYTDHGPIGGIHAALKLCESDAMVCVSCDIPLISKELVKKMSNAMTDDYDAVIAVSSDGKYHPLCGVYRKELYEILDEHILANNNRLMAILKKVRTRYMSLDKEASNQLTNVNTRDEYKELKNNY